ncbi:MAG: M48 family metallopeptidase, partial [Deltaproteobacteria bacterium]
VRLGERAGTRPARLEIADPALAAAIDQLAPPGRHADAVEWRGRWHVVGWSVAAAVSLAVCGIFGLPLVAERLTPIIPAALERKLGDALDGQLRAMLDTKGLGGGFECRAGESEKSGGAALDKLIDRLQSAATLPMPLRVSVLRRGEANALALPGGRIYVFEGLIAKSRSPDELAGVLAHEVGHVVHRDGTRSMLQGAGLSFLFGMLLGDFVGGGAVVLASRTMLRSAYSREVEAQADRYAVDLMAKAGGDGRALGSVLERISGAVEPAALSLLLDHPLTKARVAAINAAASTDPTAPLLDAEDWAALKQICGRP